MNDVSSRSHCIIRMIVEQIYQLNGMGSSKMTSVVNLVDLAGSERGRTVKGQDDRTATESVAINKSLRVLNQVISSRAAGKSHAPFRESKLTRLLYNTLGGNSYMVLVVNLSPSPEDWSETLSTLEYAQRAKKIKNKAVQNAEQVLLAQHA